MKKKIVCVFILFFVWILLSSCEQQTTKEETALEKSDDAIFCAADVQECPGGSFVARDPENDCAFKKCP